jgi:hypothetical protein
MIKNCPKCGCSIDVADRYSQDMVRIKGKSCTCLPDENMKSWPEDCQSMHERINKLEEWVKLLVESIPEGSSFGPPHYTVDAMFRDLNPSTRFAECVRQEVIERAKELGLVKPQPGRTMWIRLCNYCGTVACERNEPKLNGDSPDVEIGNNSKCTGCESVSHLDPRVFEWVTKIIQWRFKVDAWTPKKVSFEQVRVDPPPPPPPEPAKSIII